MHTEIRINKMTDGGYNVESNTYARKNSSKAHGYSSMYCDSVSAIKLDDGQMMVFGHIEGREGNIGYKIGTIVYDCRNEEYEAELASLDRFFNGCPTREDIKEKFQITNIDDVDDETFERVKSQCCETVRNSFDDEIRRGVLERLTGRK